MLKIRSVHELCEKIEQKEIPRETILASLIADYESHNGWGFLYYVLMEIDHDFLTAQEIERLVVKFLANRLRAHLNSGWSYKVWEKYANMLSPRTQERLRAAFSHSWGKE